MFQASHLLALMKEHTTIIGILRHRWRYAGISGMPRPGGDSAKLSRPVQMMNSEHCQHAPVARVLSETRPQT